MATEDSKRDLSNTNEEKVAVTRISYSSRCRSFEECQEIWKLRVEMFLRPLSTV